MCPLYPGMTCREHCDAAVDIETTRDESLIPVPFLELCPNSWLVPPHGTPERIPEKDQFVAGKVMDRVKAMQKTLGTALPRKAFDQIHNALEQAEAAAGEGAWNKALQAYRGIATLAEKPPDSLAKMIDAKMAELDEEVRYAFEDLVEPGPREETSPAQRVAGVRHLLAAVDVEVLGRKLPVAKAIAAWLEKSAGR